MKWIVRIISWFFMLIWNFTATIIMAVGVMVAMAAAGYYLLDYIVTGDEVTVPSVYGMNKAQAMETLFESDLWLNPNIEEVTNPNVEPGIIIVQRPQPNERVKKKRSVTVTVSAGARELDIPDVTGQYEEGARLTLRGNGLDVGERAMVYHEKIPEGGVIAQDPLPGKHRSYGNKVNILVSMGALPQGYIMPEYTGNDLEVVLGHLKQNNLDEVEPDVQFVPTPDASQWNRIIKQIPTAGTRMTTGEKMVFTVGSSGTTADDIHLIHIRFSYPLLVRKPETLSLLIFDESSYQLQTPIRISVDYSYGTLPIERWVPVIGNAFVMLAEVYEQMNTVVTHVHDERWYPAN